MTSPRWKVGQFFRLGTSRAGRRTNLALAVLVATAVFTGLFSNTIGVDWVVDPIFFHALAGLGIVVLIPWKSVVARRGISRRRASRWVSYLLVFLVVVALASGLTHAIGSLRRLGPLTIMQIHVGSALGALAVLLFHYFSHPVRPRTTDFNRRNFLRGAGLLGVSGLLWLGWEQTLKVAGWPGANRRFTGSHERGSFQPGLMPVTSWFDDRVPKIDPSQWEINVQGSAVSYQALQQLPQEDLEAVLDCTGGWFSRQQWRGVRLDQLVNPQGARSLLVRSATGYERRFPVSDLSNLWLATQVGGQALSPGHGFPARIVAPGRRGFWWVKWVVEIESSTRPWWLQLPFPVT